MFWRFVKWWQDRLFPVFCVGCEKEGSWLCSECLGSIHLDPVKKCPGCALSTKRGETCLKCSAVKSLDGVTAFFNYQESPALSKLITLIKYHYARSAVAAWEQIIKTQFFQLPFLSGAPARTIIPVPLHPRRERARGFNQAVIISNIIANFTSFPIDVASFCRLRSTKQQARLNRSERLTNVKGAFAWRGNRPPPQNIILVDDVFTTGATMEECARALKAAGAKEVWGVTLARD